jgi:hypothetical protein
MSQEPSPNSESSLPTPSETHLHNGQAAPSDESEERTASTPPETNTPESGKGATDPTEAIAADVILSEVDGELTSATEAVATETTEHDEAIAPESQPVTSSDLASADAVLSSEEEDWGDETLTESLSEVTPSTEDGAPSPTATPNPTPQTTSPFQPKTAAPSGVLASLQQFWQTAAPILRATIVMGLRVTIRLLQWLLRLVEGASASAHSSAEVTPSPSSNGTPSTPSFTAEPATSKPSQPKASGKFGKVLAVLTAIWSVWLWLVRGVRRLLPQPWRDRLPGFVVGTGMAGLLVFTVWISTLLTGGTPDTVAVLPTPSADRSESPVAIAPSESGDSSNLPLAGTEPATPEPDLATQLTDILEPFADDLFVSVGTTHHKSTLVVELSDTWYSLMGDRQTALAEAVWKQTQRLPFTHLELRNGKGDVIARSPAVGNAMVIIQRQVLPPV